MNPRTLFSTFKSNRSIFLHPILIAVFIFYSCGNTSEKSQEPTSGYSVKDNHILLDEHSNIVAKLSLSTVQEEHFVRELTTAGTVKAIPTAYAEIAPPFPGRILKSFVKLGQKVVPGSPVFEMSAPDYFNAEKEYFDTRQEFRQAELNLKRQQDLLKNGVGVQRELEEAETDFALKKTALSNASAALKIFNVNPEKISLGQPLIVRSPIQGEIVDNQIVIGQYVKEDAEPVAIVAELSKVWIVGQVKEKDIRFIRKLDEVEIQTASSPDQTIKGKVYHVNEIVNEETRSIEVLIECDNPKRDLKPGMYATVLFKDAAVNTIVVPATAVFQKEENQFVFVKVNELEYEKRQVETQGNVNGKVIITQGLRNGEVIVTQGGALMIRN